MNLYPKSAHLYQFIPNLCQFMLIYQRFFITYIAHNPHVDAPTPIFSSKTRIRPENQKKNLKTTNFPKIRLFSVAIYFNVGNYGVYLKRRKIAKPIF